MIRRIVKQILSIGVEVSQKKEHKKVKLLNAFCLLIVFSLLVFLADDYLFLERVQFYYNAKFHSSYAIIIFIIFLLQRKGYLLIARVLFIISLILFTWVFCLVEPGKLVEEYFLIIPLVSLTFIENKWINISILLLTCVSHYFSFKIMDAYLTISYQVPVLITLFLANYTILKYAQNLNKKQELLLAEQRDKVLSDKIILEKQEAELRELNEFKSHFFVNLSHEIRTPITLIKGYTNNLNLEDNKPINTNKLNIVNNQIKQIEGILNNILDLSKLDDNKLNIHRENHNIAILLNKLYADYKALFDKKNIEFTILSPTNTLSVNMDYNLIEKAINNLLNNALKFTPKNGKVTIQTIVKDEITIRITDNGIGVPKNDLDKIFNRFYQSENHITLSQGSGIGLSFTKSILDAHGFSIKVISEPNINTIFFITIPKEYVSTHTFKDIRAAKTEENMQTLTIQPTAKTTKNLPTILVVDDHEQMRNYLTTILVNYNILEAENGKAALAILSKKKVDLLVTDYMMPIMDGEELVNEVKKLKLKIPIIILTARVDNFAKLNMLRVGVDGYLNKPFTEEELQLYIKNSLERYANIMISHDKLSLQEKDTLNKYAEEFNNKTLDFIHKNISKSNFSVQDVAQHLNISQSTLSRRTKSIFGLTAQQFILQVKLEKARALLIKEPYLTKQQVSHHVGINNTTYLFKKLEENYGKL